MTKKKLLNNSIVKALVDCLFSFIAYAAPTIGLTFVIQPLMAQSMSDVNYGLFLTIISAVRLCVNIGISSLANTRLLVQKDYDDGELHGDFSPLFALICGAGTIITVVVTWIYGYGLWDILLSCAVIAVLMFHDYVTVEYRIIMNFKRILIDNMIILAGYIAGFFAFKYTGMWQLVFLGGYILALAYILPTTTIWRERFSITPRFRKTVRKHSELMASSALSDSINYCDKLLIYPVLGGVVVSAYNAAAVMGKAVQLVSVPIQKVLLSYIVKSNKISRKKLTIVVAAGGIAFTVAYFALYALSKLLIPIMYPQYYDEAVKILHLVIGGVIINTFAGMINIIVMRFDKTIYQVFISASRIVTYLAVSLIFVPIYGVEAFCYGILVSSIVRLAFVLMRLYMSDKK